VERDALTLYKWTGLRYAPALMTTHAQQFVRLALAAILLGHAPRSMAAPQAGIYVLAINGGGDRLDNFASHLAHLRQLVDLLTAAGIPRNHVTVLASDGDDPTPDLATREPDPDNAWLLRGTRLSGLLSDLTTYQNTVLPGVDVRPATVKSLTRAIGELKTRLHDGDTLLIYVTDHGTQSKSDPLDNRITLWGERESISARKLGALLARLPSGVRVVSLMSQCYSGGFAYMHESRERRHVPTGGTCGYFSSTPDRPAYGCYPELRGQKAIGHSFEFLSALSKSGRFASAQSDILVSDATPDIPLRSSDVYLAELLARVARSPDREAALVDPLLKQALGQPGSQPARLLDRIAAAYAVPRPSSLGDLDEHANVLFAFLDELDADGKTWEGALGDFNQANLDRFLATHPAWQARLTTRALRDLTGKQRRDVASELLAELAPFATADVQRLAEANRLLTGLNTVDDISYRTEIRVAALLRMRFIMTSAAGRVWVQRDKKESQALAALDRCEDFTLGTAALAGSPSTSATPPTFPALSVDQQRATNIRPGWLGITFVPVSSGRRKHLGLPEGAAQITTVLPRSPASKAGMRAGDIVLGPPQQPFLHRSEIRPFIAAARPGTELSIEIARGKTRLALRPRVGEAPVVVPSN
jgi:hypothetical protein